MTESEMVAVIRVQVAKLGNLRSSARKLGVAVSYLHDVLHGRRSPGPAILRPLGYRRVEASYEKVK